MFSEYDVVIARKALSEKVKLGSIGAVLMCFDGKSYEVEFTDELGESLEVLTVSGVDLILQSGFHEVMKQEGN